MNSRLRRVLSAVWPPLLFGAVFLALWQFVVKAFDLKPYFLAAPTAIIDAFFGNWSNIWDAMTVSGLNALIGLVLGVVLGVAMSFVLRRFQILDDIVTPLAVALNAIPIFVLVAVFNNMFTITSQVPRRLMVMLVVYFIVLVNVARGLIQVSQTHLELMRSYAASESDIMRKVRIPNAVPYLFTALKIAAPAAVITSFVSEYFGGSQDGLGSAITGSIAASKNAVAWAYVIGACLVGLAFYLISILMEAIATPRGAGAVGRTS